MVNWHIPSAPEIPHYLSAIAHTCKICVAIYCFLTGYGYAFSKNKNLRYGLTKCADLLKRYWLQLFLFFIPVAIISGYKLSPQLLVRNLFGLSPNLNFFAWYVYFYIFAMLILPVFTNWEKLWKKPWICLFSIVGLCYVAAAALHSLPIYESNILIADLFNCMIYFPGVILGYVCARYKAFEYLDSKLPKSPWIYAVAAIAILLCRTIISSIMGLPLDIYYGSLFVYCCYRVIKHKWMKYPGKALSVCGKYSTPIWFFHAVFFSTYIRDYCQWIIWLPRNPIFVFIWCMLICLLVAIPLELLINCIDKLGNYIIRKKRDV